MSTDTKYSSIPYLFRSRGIVARPIIDRAPEFTYLNLANVEEREEDAFSSRYGCQIVNRDPDSVPLGTNYLLPQKPTTLTRLKSLLGSTFRYANSGSLLYRRAGDTQGPYASIFNGLSGNSFSSIVASCFESAQPFLFIADAAQMIKDMGIGTPTKWGINPPTQVVNALQYSPQITEIDNFLVDTGYTVTGGLTIFSRTVFAVVNGNTGTPVLDYEEYISGDLSARLAQSGMLGVDTTSSNRLRQIFNIAQDTTKFDINPLGTALLPTTVLDFGAVNATIGSNATGTIGKTANFDFSAADDDDLFVLVIQVSGPAAVQEIRLQFDIDGSDYTSNYYYKSLIPAAYQSAISLPQVTDPTQAINAEVFGRASGAVNLNQIGEPFQNITPDDDPSIPQLQPSTITTGVSSWSVMYIRKGDFLPIGNAGKPGLDWSKITGWNVQVTTNTQGSTDVSINALYLQGGFGPSSYGGVGYDARYTYYNANTGTESNPSATPLFATTPVNPGGLSTLIPLRQALQISGQYSTDPQVTHINVYVRGGVANQNWFFADRIPNVTGTAAFNYKYTFPDSTLLSGDPIKLDNDVPVTSTLQTPIVTALTAPLTPTDPIIPITIDVTDGTAVFVPNQIVDIGTPDNLEQVYVVAGGTGTFTACIQLAHAAGEAVQVFSIPGQPVNLGALAYGNIWLAGDPNNPHLLYYSNAGFPENFSPAQYIKVSSPSDPITAVVNFRGTLFVATVTTWYQIFPGNPPYAQPTGSKHGCVAPFGWTQTESAIWYQAIDGIREFRGVDGAYRSLPIEWLFQNVNQALTPIPIADPTLFSTFQMAFQNNKVFSLYFDKSTGAGHRVIWDTNYQRWRNDDVNATAIYFEEDINSLLYAKFLIAGDQRGYAICQDRIGDYDDGGWINGALVQTPIALNLQTPFNDMGAPNNQKQFNVLTFDANTAGQTLNISLIFDDTGPTLDLGNVTSNAREKFQLKINDGLGQQAYRMSVKITGPTVVAPILYQLDIHAAILAEQRSSYDSYWIKFGQDESKLVKQGYYDYTSSAPVTVSLYADGETTPYYVFVLPANPNRAQVARRKRYPTRMLRMFRVVGTVPAGETLQIWANPQQDQKAVIVGKGYQRSELVTQ